MFQLLSLTPLFDLPFLGVLADKSATASMGCAVAGTALYLVTQGVNPFLVLRNRIIAFRPALPLIGLMILSLGVLSLFSIVPERSFLALIKLLLLASFGFILVSIVSHAKNANRPVRVCVIGFVISLIAAITLIADLNLGLAAQVFGERRPDYYQNAAALQYAVFIWPVLYCATHMGLHQKLMLLFALLVFGLTSLGIFMSENQSAQLGVMLGLIALGLYHILPSHRRMLVYGLSLGGFAFALTAPFWGGWLAASGLQIDLPFSFAHRLIIWQAVGEGIAQRPLLGYGLDVSRYIPLPEYVARLGEWARYADAHAHNVALVFWFELGIFGLALGFCLVFLLARGVFALQPKLQGLAFASLICGLSQILLSKHFIQNWMLSCFIVVIAIFTLLHGLEKQRAQQS